MLEMEGTRDAIIFFFTRGSQSIALGRVKQNGLCALLVESQYFVSFFFFKLVVGKDVFKFQQQVLTFSFFTDRELEVQRRLVTCPKPPS